MLADKRLRCHVEFTMPADIGRPGDKVSGEVVFTNCRELLQ
jgi:hypothetical protein